MSGEEPDVHCPRCGDFVCEACGSSAARALATAPAPAPARPRAPAGVSWREGLALAPFVPVLVLCFAFGAVAGAVARMVRLGFEFGRKVMP